MARRRHRPLPLPFAGMALRFATRVHDLLARPPRDVLSMPVRCGAIAVPAVLTNVATPLANGVFASVIAVRRSGHRGDRHHRPARAGRIRRALRADRRGRAHPRAELGGTPLRPDAAGSEGFRRLHGCVCARRMDPARRSSGASRLLQGAGHHRGAGPVLLPHQRLHVVLHRAAVRRERLVQQSGLPDLSTGFTWARATLGIVPFAFLGAHLGGPKGAIAGVALGSVAFGVAAIVTAFWTIRKLESRTGLARVV